MRVKIDRNDILEAGLDLMYLHGYNDTGIKDITDKVGIPKGSFYNHFKNKEEFGLEALETYTANLTTLLAEYFENADQSPLDRLRALFQYYIEAATEELNYKKGCFAGNMAQELGDTSDTFNQALQASFAQIVGQFEKCITEAVAQGQVSSRHTPEYLANFTSNSLQGALLRVKAEKSAAPLEQFITILFEMVLI